MISEKKITEFIEPYYSDKDIMHNMWHIELVKRQVSKIIKAGNFNVDEDVIYIALAFHGFIYKDEERIRRFLFENNVSPDMIDKIVKVSWESQRPEQPETLEGKILHDAHVLEGGKSYTVVKTLITGSVRGQSLEDTLAFMKNNVLGANKCYLPETTELCKEMNEFTEEFYNILFDGIKE